MLAVTQLACGPPSMIQPQMGLAWAQTLHMQDPECQGHTLKMLLKMQDAAQGAEGAGVCERARLAWVSVKQGNPGA